VFLGDIWIAQAHHKTDLHIHYYPSHIASTSYFSWLALVEWPKWYLLWNF